MTVKEVFEYSLPEALEGLGEIAILDEEGELIEVDMYSVLDSLERAEEEPVKVLTHLLKVRQGLSAIGSTLTELHTRTEDFFRVWRAEEERILNLKDDRNPLVKEGMKTTNDAIQAYLRAQPKYLEFKTQINEAEVAKNSVWGARTTVDHAIDAVKAFMRTGSAEVEE